MLSLNLPPLKRKLLILAGTMFVLLLLTFFGSENYFFNNQKGAQYKNIQDQITYDKWFKEIKKVGSKKAYLEFKTENILLNRQHRNAHLFGEALYRIEGVNGISACDTTFNYGCYHSLMGLAINDQGMEASNTLLAICSKDQSAEGSCLHGIGHGILSTIGYDLDSLNKALGLCGQLRKDDTVSGCFNGVFMEFNSQTMLSSEGRRREYDPENPYFPCNQIPGYYSGFCMFEQSRWWLIAINKNREDKISQIDSLCQNQTDKVNRSLCYKGLGMQLLSYFNNDVNQAKQSCQSLSSRESQLVCNAGIEIYLQTTSNINAGLVRFCGDPAFTPNEQEFCRLQTTQTSAFPE